MKKEEIIKYFKFYQESSIFKYSCKNNDKHNDFKIIESNNIFYIKCNECDSEYPLAGGFIGMIKDFYRNNRTDGDK